MSVRWQTDDLRGTRKFHPSQLASLEKQDIDISGPGNRGVNLRRAGLLGRSPALQPVACVTMACEVFQNGRYGGLEFLQTLLVKLDEQRGSGNPQDVHRSGEHQHFGALNIDLHQARS